MPNNALEPDEAHPKKKTQDGNYDVLRLFAKHGRKQKKSIIHIIENAQEGKRSRWMVYREQLSKKVEITKNQNRLSVMTALILSPLFLSFFCTIFFVSHISYAFTIKVYKFHDF